MGTKIKSVERGSQATPLAEDIIKMLQGELSEGAFGTGVGPLQRGAGTSIQQFMAELDKRAPVDTAEGARTDLTQLISDLENISARNVGRQAGDLRESMGIAGSRYGTTLAKGEGMMRGGAAMDLSALIGNIMREENARVQQARQFDVGAQLGMDQLLLGAIGQMFGMGTQAQQPFMQMGEMGVEPEEITATPNPWMQLLTAYITAGGQAATGAAGG